MPNGESNRFWDQLLQLIEEGRVVPVVGKDLLTVGDGGPDGLLYPLLARRLADYLGLSAEGLPEGGELNEVACRLMARGDQLEDLYPALKSVVESVELAVPESLLRLAAIRPFKLFVSTTFDPLLARALDQVRHGGKAKTAVLAFSPTEADDLPSQMERLDRPTVYHLLGKLSAFPAYAVTQEDTLEFLHAVQSETRQPARLFDELSRGSLLILGSSFGGWLARFFLRTAKRQRLLMARGADYVADARISGDSNLTLFLRHFSKRTKLFTSGGAAEFVDELARRWSERHPATGGAEAGEPAAARASGGAGIEAGAVFLSYASEDREAVERIRDRLEAAGVDIFFDKDELRAGDDFEARLLRSIGDCSLFIPVISRNTLTRRRRFFRLEWDAAVKEARKAAPGETFILPLVIDETAPEDPAVPEIFRRLHWQRTPGGEAGPDLVRRVQELFRRFHKLAAETA